MWERFNPKHVCACVRGWMCVCRDGAVINTDKWSKSKKVLQAFRHFLTSWNAAKQRESTATPSVYQRITVAQHFCGVTRIKCTKCNPRARVASTKKVFFDVWTLSSAGAGALEQTSGSAAAIV